MLSERQLEALLKLYQDRMQAVTDEYLRLMGEHLRDMGSLSPTDVHRLKELRRVGANVKRMKREIAKAANISVKDLEKTFRAVAESDEQFAAQWFAEVYVAPVKGAAQASKPIERIIKAQLRVTAQAFKNLSQTTILSESYRSAVDVAVQTVQAGVVDYRSAIRATMKKAAVDGLRVKYPSGASRRLDTAVRQNVLDGVRALNNDILRQLGKEYGADGVEISAHYLCAEDHLPYQGRQFSQKEFDALQARLDRPFGMWNCKHTIFPIILGVSEPAHSDRELEEINRNSSKRIDIGGRSLSRYEWTQEQRKIETAVRAQKDIANLAKVSGDDVARRDAQAKINALMDRYDRITEAAGLETDYKRMYVAGFRQVKAEEPLKNPAENVIIQVAGQTVNTKMREQKQQEHIIGSKAFDRRTEAAITKGSGFPSGFMAGTDVQALVMAHMGKGTPDIGKSGAISEYFDADGVVGWTYERNTGTYVLTRRVCVRYSKTGWHAFPVEEV
jgi:hypothetical protein